MDKYKMIESTIPGRYRVQALKDFECQGVKIHKGDVGGFVENKFNLDQAGNCWIFDDAVVCEQARVKYNSAVGNHAVIAGHAQVSGAARIVDGASMSGYAKAGDYALLEGNASMRDFAEAHDESTLGGNAVMVDRSQIGGRAIVEGECELFDYAEVAGQMHLSGTAELYAKIFLNGDFELTEGTYSQAEEIPGLRMLTFYAGTTDGPDVTEVQKTVMDEDEVVEVERGR